MEMVLVFAAFALASAGLVKGYSYVSGDGPRYKFVGRYMRRVPRFDVARFPDGKYGRVVGIARPIGETLLSPITGRPCVFFIVKITQPYYRQRRTGDAHVARREASTTAFRIDDGTGSATVDPSGAQGMLAPGSVATGNCANARGSLSVFLQAVELEPSPYLMYEEWIVAPDERIAVIGGGTREPDPEAPPAAEYRGDAVMRLRIAQTPPYPVIISNTPATLK